MYHLTTSTRKFRLACFTLLWLATQRLSFRLVDQSFRSITCSEDFKKEICYIFLVLENFQNRIASEVAVRNVCKNISKSKKCQEILYYLKKDSCSPPSPQPMGVLIELLHMGVSLSILPLLFPEFHQGYFQWEPPPLVRKRIVSFFQSNSDCREDIAATRRCRRDARRPCDIIIRGERQKETFQQIFAPQARFFFWYTLGQSSAAGENLADCVLFLRCFC